MVVGDCSDRVELEAQGLSRADAYVGLTGVDDMNMIGALYAGSRGVAKVITKLSRQGSTEMADSLDVGSVVCPRELSADSVVRYVRALGNTEGAAVRIHSFADGQAEAVEFLVDKHTRNCGIPLKQLKLKPGVLIAIITHGAKTEIPNGDSCFHKDDAVVVVTSGRGVLKDLNDIFA